MIPESFALDAMNLEDVSVGREEDEFNVTCRSHDGDGKIETEAVHDLARQHDLRVINCVADFDAGEVRLELQPAGGVCDA